MKSYLKKSICLIMLFLMCDVLVTYASIDLATFNNRIATFRTEKYDHGSTYQDNPSLTGGYTCFGFANEVALYIWGSYPTKSMSAASVNSGWTVTYGGSAVDNLCVGDIVRYHYHSIFITGIDGDTIYYCQANTPSGTNKVTFNNTISRRSLKSKVSDQLTSPGTTKTGWVAHYTDGISSTPPEVEQPTATLSVDRKKYNPNDVVTFTFGGNNNGTYTLGIYKDYDRIDTVTVIGNTYTRKFDTGMYSAYMTAYNDVGYADSNWVDWQVNDLTAYLYVNAESFAQGDTVTLTFDGNNSLKYSNGPCTLGIFKDGTLYDTVTVYEEIYTRVFNEAGEYSAYMTAYSETEYKDSNWVYWTVKEWPSAPILKCPDFLYDVNNDLTFEWNDCQKADYYDFWVYQGDEAVHTTCYIEGLSHKLRLPEGTYKAKVASVNKKYSTWTWSNEYEFTVVNDFPERPILSINNIEFESGDDIVISWNNCINTDDYDLYIYDKDGNTILTEFYYTQLSKNVSLPQGSYISKVASVNRTKGTWLWSNEVQFTVKEKSIKVPYIDCTVTKCNSTHYINVVPVNIDDSCEIIIAGYKGGKFVTVTSVPYKLEEANLTLFGDIDEIKVMVWDSLSGLKPLCNAEVIPSSEFIVE